MASNKMLIDASHPEETRVVVLRGNRIEEFDFESQNKQQLKGNIYLAKVTRVEPSLQAAFVDYGGNRHGFLAFNEIHPDYYQIPVADRQALLDEEAEDARLDKLKDDELDNQQQSTSENKADSSSEDEATKEEKPAPKKRKRRARRTSRKAAAEQQDEETTESSSEEPVEAANGEARVDNAEPAKTDEEAKPVEELQAKSDDEVQAAAEEAEEKPKPRRTRRTARRTSRKKVEQKADEDDSDAVAQEETASEESQPAENNEVASVEVAVEEVETPQAESDEQSDGKPTSIAAMMETDSISEPAPEDNSDEEPSQDEAEDTPEQTAKPKRRSRSTSRPGKKVKAEEQQPEAELQSKAEENVEPEEAKAKSEGEENNSDESETKATEEVSAADEVKEASDNDDAESKSAEATSDEETELKSDNVSGEEEKPKSKRRRRTSRSKKKKADLENADESGLDNNVIDAAEAPQPVIEANAADNDEAVELDANGEEVETSGQEDAMEEVPQRRSHRRQYKIQEVIKRRQVLLVQVVKEERGNKGAALTTYLSLAGRYSVLMPNTARGGGISRKITNSADRKRLKTIASELAVPEGMGVILRTAGASRTKEEIQRDFEYLMRLWENVRSLTLSSSAPCLVYEEGSLIKRSIRDLYDKNTGEIHVAGEAGYREAKDFMNMLMPSHTNRVHFYQDEQAMYARYGVEQQLDKMLSQQVTLKSGGYLVIDQTEALVAIDVNSGRATREHSIEDTALQTNLETAEEVARQLRLRDLAGLIVIDFIDMEEKRNNRAVEKKLKECLKHDRARIQVGRISHFGLLEMSRQRMRASVMDSTTDVCPNLWRQRTCAFQFFGLPAYSESNRRTSAEKLRFDLNIKTSMETAAYILNHKRGALSEIELRFGVKLYIEGRHDIMGENYAIEKGEISTGERVPLNHIQVGHLSDADNADRDEKPGKKRRRRRNRGNKEDRTEEVIAEAKEEVSAEQPEEVAEDGEKPNKKRTRGKRGGRNKRKSKDETASTDAAESVEAIADNAPEGETSENQSVETVEAEAPVTETQEQERPKRRNTRRKTAKVSKEADETSADDQPTELNGTAVEATDEHTAPEEAEKPERTRRRTSRKKASAEEAEEASTAEHNSSESDAETPVAEAASANEAPAVEASAADEADDKSKKRGGWWSRGGFFK